MPKRFIYFYFMKNEFERIREIIPSHINYWKTSGMKNYLGGPFADRTGGLISFESSSLEKATGIVKKDPFVVHDLIETKWIKEWLPE